MKINIKKTEVMTISWSNKQIHLKIENEDIQRTNIFIYLDSIFTEDGKTDREIETRIRNANNVSYLLAPLLKHTEMYIPTKRQMIKCICIPMLCYKSPKGTLNQTQTQKI
jgi:hypothetical protein